MLQRLVAGLSSILLLALTIMPSPVAASPLVRPESAHARLVLQPELRITPKNPRPGDVIIVRVKIGTTANVAGEFGDRSVRFAPEFTLTNTQDYIALIGLDALIQPGTYTLTVTVVADDNNPLQVFQPIKVLPRTNILERVRLSRTLTPTLDPAANAAEALIFTQLYGMFTERKLWSGPFKLPVKGRFSALYGNRRIYNGINLGTYHGGYDIVARTGTPAKAAAPGQVVAVKLFIVHGLTVVIDHGHGVFTAYSHLSRVEVAEGQMVSTGDVIGKVGSTGRSQGPHLHFEVAVGGATIDPGYWLRVALP